MNKHIDATSDAIENREQQFDVGEILTNGPKPIDLASENVLKGDSLDHERFMAEMVEVHLHEPVSENEPAFCYVGVNGDSMWLARGGTYQLKRYHVAILADAKTGRVVQKKHVSPDGSQTYIDSEVLTLAYPFTVIADPNPRGGAWLRERLRRAG